jgi:hypothetical protein
VRKYQRFDHRRFNNLKAGKLDGAVPSFAFHEYENAVKQAHGRRRFHRKYEDSNNSNQQLDKKNPLKNFLSSF